MSFARSIRRAAALIAVLTLPPRLGAEPVLRIDERTFRTYGICSGTIRSPEGFSGTLELRGRRFDGREVPLFRAELPGWTASLEFKFIPDENIRTIYAAGSERELELPLSRGDTAAAGRRFLGSLSPPFRSRPPAVLPNTARLRARDPGDAGSAAARLFARPREPRTGGILAAFAAGALCLAALRRRMGRAYMPALLVLAAAGMAGMAAAGRPDAGLYRFPLPDPRGPYDLEVRVRLQRGPGLTVVRFEPEEDWRTRPSLSVLGIRTPPGRPLPLDLLPEGALFRFLDPPLVLRKGNGEFALHFEGFALGWELHE